MAMTKNASAGTDGANMLGMQMVHRVFRREFAALAHEASRPHDPARRAALEDQLGFVLRVLHEHHCGEDTLMWPVVLQRAPEAAPVLSTLEAEHEELDPLIQRAGDTSLSLAGRAGTLRELSGKINAHLDREEHDAFPLLERYVTADEFSALDKKMMKACGNDLPALAGAAMWHATPEEQRRALTELPRILGIMWRLSWRRKYARRVRRTYGRQADGRPLSLSRQQ
jgi:hemerythrin-like domain-containing protein